jgi:hypothetical protein
MVDAALERVRSGSPAGWVYFLAESLGARHDDAMAAASFCEMYYAMCSYTDDVQDGDAASYMPETDGRLLVNTVAQIICLTATRGCILAERFREEDVLEEVSFAFRTGATMLTGQRIEIVREGWNVDSYRQVAVMSGGRQFDVYFRMASLAAGVSSEPFLHLSDPMAILVQMMHDRESEDERLLGLPPEDVQGLREQARHDLEQAAARVPEESRNVIARMIALADS